MSDNSDNLVLIFNKRCERCGTYIEGRTLKLAQKADRNHKCEKKRSIDEG